MTDRSPLPAAAAALLCAALLLGGCGYRLLGAGEGTGAAQGGPAALVVGALDDRSREPLFGAILRRALTGQASERAEVRLAAEGDPGALKLDITVNELTAQGRAYVAGGLPREYLLSVRADAVLRDAGGKPRWKVSDVAARREYAAGADLNATRANKEAALRLLADDLAGELLRNAAVGAARIERAKP